jgi:hypothetical protein
MPVKIPTRLPGVVLCSAILFSSSEWVSIIFFFLIYLLLIPYIFTCVASQYLILCDITATATATTTPTTPPRFLKFYLE